MRFSSVRALVAAGVLLSLLFALVGCGGASSSGIGTTPPPPAPSEFLFATSNANVLVFSVDTSTGALTLESNGPSAPGGFGIAANPSASFLYSSNDTAGGVAGFSINQTGALSAVNGSPFLLPNDPPYSNLNNVDSLAMHPSGQFLYAPDSPANEVVAFAIDSPTGVLTPIPGSPFPAGTQPEQSSSHRRASSCTYRMMIPVQAQEEFGHSQSTLQLDRSQQSRGRRSRHSTD